MLEPDIGFGTGLFFVSFEAELLTDPLLGPLDTLSGEPVDGTVVFVNTDIEAALVIKFHPENHDVFGFGFEFDDLGKTLLIDQFQGFSIVDEDGLIFGKGGVAAPAAEESFLDDRFGKITVFDDLGVNFFVKEDLAEILQITEGFCENKDYTIDVAPKTGGKLISY